MRRRFIKKWNREYFRRERKKWERNKLASIVRFYAKKSFFILMRKRVRSASKINYVSKWKVK